MLLHQEAQPGRRLMPLVMSDRLLVTLLRLCLPQTDQRERILLAPAMRLWEYRDPAHLVLQVGWGRRLEELELLEYPGAAHLWEAMAHLRPDMLVTGLVSKEARLQAAFPEAGLVLEPRGRHMEAQDLHLGMVEEPGQSEVMLRCRDLLRQAQVAVSQARVLPRELYPPAMYLRPHLRLERRFLVQGQAILD